MKPILLISLLFPFVWGVQARASSLEICEYKIKILSTTENDLRVDVIETLVSPGFNAKLKILACQGKIKKGRIPMDEISQGKALATKGVTLKAEWRSYSAMTPNGPTNSVSWKLFPLKN